MDLVSIDPYIMLCGVLRVACGLFTAADDDDDDDGCS